MDNALETLANDVANAQGIYNESYALLKATKGCLLDAWDGSEAIDIAPHAVTYRSEHERAGSIDGTKLAKELESARTALIRIARKLDKADSDALLRVAQRLTVPRRKAAVVKATVACKLG